MTEVKFYMLVEREDALYLALYDSEKNLISSYSNLNQNDINNYIENLENEKEFFISWEEEKSSDYLKLDEKLISYLLGQDNFVNTDFEIIEKKEVENIALFIRNNKEIEDRLDIYIEINDNLLTKNNIVGNYIYSQGTFYKVDIEEVDEVVAGLKGTEYYHAVRLASSPVEIEKEFALKSMRKAKPDTSFDEVIIPAYKDEEDTHLAAELLRTTIVHEEEYREIINKNLRNWDMDRVTDVDMIILQMALAELLSFPTIPTTVTLNEYIELAKIYSTAESGVFVNGLLDSALHQLRNERRILKF